MGEVVGASHSAVHKVREAIARPLWAPVDTKPPVVVIDESLAHRLEVGGRHVAQELRKVY